MPVESGWARLAEAMRAEAARRYRTEREFAQAAGVGLRTVEKLLAGQRASYREQTIAGVEAALGWEAGSAGRVVEGMQPVRVSDPELARIRDAWPHLSRRDRRIMLTVLDALRK